MGTDPARMGLPRQPFLLGGAKGTAVMINSGKTVPGLPEHFICVEQQAVVGEPSGK